MLRGPRFLFCDKIPDSQGELSPENSHYIARVLRGVVGSEVLLVNAQSKRAVQATIIETSPKVTVEVTAEIPFEETHSFVHYVHIGLLKQKKNDFLVEKLTELGVSNILFFQGQHSIATHKGSELKFLKHLREIAKTASQQCGRMLPPAVGYFPSLKDSLESQTEDHASQLITCSLEESSVPLYSVFHKTQRCSFVIGPEGDLSENEMRLLKDKESIFVTLGNLRLRSETAAIAAVSAAQLRTEGKQSKLLLS